jgi:hypothetical protein
MLKLKNNKKVILSIFLFYCYYKIKTTSFAFRYINKLKYIFNRKYKILIKFNSPIFVQYLYLYKQKNKKFLFFYLKKYIFDSLHLNL